MIIAASRCCFALVLHRERHWCVARSLLFASRYVDGQRPLANHHLLGRSATCRLEEAFYTCLALPGGGGLCCSMLLASLTTNIRRHAWRVGYRGHIGRDMLRNYSPDLSSDVSVICCSFVCFQSSRGTLTFFHSWCPSTPLSCVIACGADSHAAFPEKH